MNPRPSSPVRACLRLAARLAALLLAGVLGVQGMALSFQRGAGGAHVHALGAAGAGHEHGPSADHHHDSADASVVHLDDGATEAAGDAAPPVVRDLDKVIAPAPAAPIGTLAPVHAAQGEPALRSVVLAPAQRPPDA